MAVGDGVNVTGSGEGGKWRLPMRYLMAIMGSIGLAIIYSFKVNVSVAIVAMVNKTGVKLESDEYKNVTILDVCGYGNNVTNTETEDGPFLWNERLQGYILSAYFWGYLVSLMPGGRMSELFSARWMMNGSVLLNAVASILSPLAAELHYSVFMVMRFLQGIGGGVTFPAMHVMISKWAPPDERSVLVSIVYAGTALGTVISILLSGLLAAKLGWIWIFYIEGALCFIWCLAWWLMIEDSPEQQTRFISQQEKDYIVNSLGQKNKNDSHDEKPPVPWLKIFTSPPFLAILFSHFCNNFGWYMLLIELPTFMNQILKFEMSSNAGLSAMPFLCMWLFTMILSKVLSIMQDKKLISVTLSRKIGTWIAAGVPAICLVGVSFAGCDRSLAVIFMTIGVTSIGGMYCGFLANHIDIAPRFAGTLVAITNSLATVPGFLVPIFVGVLTEGNQTIEAWRIVFLVTVALYVVEIIIYTIFGSGKEQSWNRIKSPTDEELATDQTLPLKDKDNY